MKRKAMSIVVCLTLVITAFAIMPLNVGAVDEDDIEQAIVDGLLWLADQQNPTYGYWDSGSHGWYIPVTAFVIFKFETYAIETGQLVDGKIEEILVPWDGVDDYYPNVEDGFDYLFANAHKMTLTDPDGNDDDYAVYWGSGSGSTYWTSVVMLALSASTHPELSATIDGVVMSYEDILQNCVDYLVWGQNDGATQGDYRGSWGYGPNSGGDQSNAGYAVLALAYAQSAPPYGFGLEIPQTTKDELDYWIDEVQCTDGGSKYTPSWDYFDPEFWENTLKTGNLLFQMAFVEDTKLTSRVQDAIDYIETHWYDDDLIEGWGWPTPSGPTVAQYQATYCLMKGFEFMNIEVDELDGITDWFQDFADVIVPQQHDDGYWPDSPCYVWPPGWPGYGAYGTMAGTVLSTVWALLTLERAAPPSKMTVVDLIADGGSEETAIDVGEVYIWNNDEYLYVKYVTTDDWWITWTHLHVADDLGDIPAVKHGPNKGSPIPGLFDYNDPHDPPVQEYTYTIDWTWDPGTTLYIAAHAKVKDLNDIVDYTDVGEQLYLTNGGTESSEDALYTVEITEENAVVTKIHDLHTETNFDFVTHIGATPDGETIYLVGEDSGHLGAYSVSDGTFTDLGYINGYPGNVVQVAVSPEGQLYMVSKGTEKLYSVDISGPSATEVGATGINVEGADIAFDADGILYLYSAGSLQNLYTVDTDTGAATLIGHTGVTITGLAIRDGGIGDLVGSDTGNDEIVTIDKTTGVIGLTYPMKIDDGMGNLIDFEHNWGDMTVGALREPIYREETAWGNGTDFPGNNWAMYIVYIDP